jgi:hypothetical protein
MIQNFKIGRMSVVNDVGSERPSTVKIKQKAYQRTRDNRRISTDVFAFEIGISHGKKRFKDGLRFN